MVRHERVGRVLALANHRKTKTLGEGHRYIFHRMHRNVGVAIEQRALELFHEQTLAPYFGQRRVEDYIAARAHREQLNA